jgi:hypothetical protein
MRLGDASFRVDVVCRDAIRATDGMNQHIRWHEICGTQHLSWPAVGNVAKAEDT